MKRIIKILAAVYLVPLIILSSCKKEIRPDNSMAKNKHENVSSKEKVALLALQKKLVWGLGGGLGSTVGPGGDLFVPDGAAGTLYGLIQKPVIIQPLPADCPS